VYSRAMAKYDFTTLYSHFPSVIDKMPRTFNSQQFVIELARLHQVDYVRALYVYRDTLTNGAPTPFQVVNRILANKLKDFPEWLELVKSDAVGVDIFGQPGPCTEWRKIK
jgi:hypothetical protein